MDMKVKKNIAIGLLAISVCSIGSVAQPKTVEAGWLGDVLDSVIGSASGGKVIKRNSAKQIDKILHQAIRANDYDMAVKAIEQGADVNSMYENRLPLSYALGNVGFPKHDTRVADLLISKGADIEGWYDTDLKHFFVFETDSWDVIQYLLDKGLNVNIKGNANENLVMRVTSMPEDWYSKIRRHQLLQELVNKGVDVNARATRDYAGYKAGDCPLISAASRGDIESARILLYAGANKNSRNNNGKTALDIAIDRGNNDMIKLLMNWN